MKFVKWVWLVTVVKMVPPCVVIAAAVFYDDNYVCITHVDGLKMWNRISAIAIDYYPCSTRPGRSIAKCKR